MASLEVAAGAGVRGGSVGGRDLGERLADGDLGAGQVLLELGRPPPRCRRPRAGRAGGCGEPAWSWALRRIRSIWASASFSSAISDSAMATSRGEPVSADEREVQGQVPLVELLVRRARLDRVGVGVQGACGPASRASSVASASAGRPAISSTARARQTSRDRVGVGRGHRHAAVGLAGGDALGHQHGRAPRGRSTGPRPASRRARPRAAGCRPPARRRRPPAAARRRPGRRSRSA